MVDNRQKEKEESRKKDLDRLLNGEITKKELSKENGFFSSLDIKSFKILGITKVKNET